MEKSISLKDTINLLINLEKAHDNLENSTKVLDGLGIPFNRFSAIEHSLGIVGCGLSHLSLMKTIKPNTLVLEDDIKTTDKVEVELRYPEEADAIYLGVSNHGYIRSHPTQGFRGVVLASQYTSRWKRVLNMCSTHAILYLSDRYIKAVSSKVEHCVHNGIAFDVGIASLHKDFIILTPNDPVFYQTDQPHFTNLSLQV